MTAGGKGSGQYDERVAADCLGVLWTCYCGAVAPLSPGSFPHPDCDGGLPVVAPAAVTRTGDQEDKP